MKFKKGMLLKSVNNKTILKLKNKKGGNGHWTCNVINSKKSHTVHEGTLKRFYTEYRSD